WCAYERAVRLADGFSPDAAVVQALRDHCRRRQASIESTLPPEEAGRPREGFDAELAFGLRYQRAYQGEEGRVIRRGGAVDGPWSVRFDEEHGPIASPVGPEEQIGIVKRGAGDVLAFVLLGAGIGACVPACLLRLLRRAGSRGAGVDGGGPDVHDSP